MFIFLIVIVLCWLLSGTGALFLTYNNEKSPYYGQLTLQTIFLGLACGPGALLHEVLTYQFFPDNVVFKRK